jgi:hypothetical protein
MTNRLPYVYGMSAIELEDFVNQGVQLTCPRCYADLEVALSNEEAKEKNIRRGVFCPNNENHVGILLSFVEDHLSMRKLFAEMREERERLEASKPITEAK